MASQQKKIQHLFLRAGFGETPAKVNSLLNISIPSIVDSLFSDSKEYEPLNYLAYPIPEDEDMNNSAGVNKVLKMFLRSKKEKEELNEEWVIKMSTTTAVLREKMTFFWHNHFATGTPMAYLMQIQNNTIRQHALENFGDLLHAIAKDPAMILYLNNQQNKRAHPNENFAREVMELFTLGIGHYTENDIKESARAFTGWAVNKSGEYQFNEQKHDFGEKEFMGQKGNFNGDDILNIILSNKQVSIFVVTKIYREFVNQNVNTERVNQLADDFFKSNFDISALMRQIFTADWFYDDENIGSKVSSPVELIVRYKKLVALDSPNRKTLTDVQKGLGQVLFFPPNVAGWKGGNTWIDSSSLLLRLSIPMYIIRGEGLALKTKPQPEETGDDTQEEPHNERGKITADWSNLVTAFKNMPEDKRQKSMLDYFIQCDTSRIDGNLLKTNWARTDTDNLTMNIGAIMSLPEFQLI